MKPRHAQPRSRTALAVTLCAVTGLVIGAAGTATAALWSDRTPLNGSISSGYEYFAAGKVGGLISTPQPTQPDTVVVPSGWESAAASDLIRNESVAVVFETQSLSQGNKGLSYEIHEPTSWGESIFADSEVSLYWVPTPADCAVGTPQPEIPDTVLGYESHPVSADYSDSTTVVKEYWCLLATYEPPTIEGQYENTATVTGRSFADEVLTDSDQWWVNLEKQYNPAEQGPLPITFTYSTHRPQHTADPISDASEFGDSDHE